MRTIARNPVPISNGMPEQRGADRDRSFLPRLHGSSLDGKYRPMMATDWKGGQALRAGVRMLRFKMSTNRLVGSDCGLCYQPERSVARYVTISG